MYQDTKLKPIVAGIGFATFVGFSFMAIKVCVPIANTVEILLFRYGFAALGALVYQIVTRSLSYEKIDKKAVGLMALFYLLFILFQTIGLIFSTSIMASIVLSSIPIIVLIFARIFLKEKTTVLQNIFAFITVGAVISLVISGTNKVEINLIGTVLLILAAFMMSICNLLMRHFRGKYRPIEFASTVSLLGFIMFASIYIIYSIIDNNYNTYRIIELLTNTKFIFATAYLGIPCILLSVLLSGYVFSRLEAVQSAIFNNLSTAISVCAGVIILKEGFSSFQLLCTGLIVLGVIGVNIKINKKVEKINNY